MNNRPLRLQTSLFRRLRLLLCLPLFLSAACAPSPHFTSVTWRRATPQERQPLAQVFLRQYDVKTLTLTQVESLLGKPDSERDAWEYALSPRGICPEYPTLAQVSQKYPELTLMFQQGKVREVYSEDGLKIKPMTLAQAGAWPTSPSEARKKRAAYWTKRGSLLGRSKLEIRRLLGKPEREMTEREIIYDLGDDGVIDSVWLSFTVDKIGRVTGGQVNYG